MPGKRWLGFCYQPHLQDADWSSSGSDEVQITVTLLIFSLLLYTTPPPEVRTKSMELKQITSVNKRENQLVLFSWDMQMM